MNINNASTNVFGGSISIDGSVDTKNAQPVFDMALRMKDLDIAQSFQGFEMFQKLVPIISAFQGKMTTDIKLAGALNGDLTPVLTSITGDAFAQLLTKQIKTEGNPLLAKLDDKLSFISLADIDISNIATKLNFKDGKVEVSPFDFKIKDMKVTASGTHSLTNEMNYTLALNVPAQYLGKEGASLLSKLSATEVASLNVPVPVQIGGSMTKPTVNVNLQSAITNLSNQIVAIQTAKLKDKGQDAINNAVNNALGGKNPLTGLKDVISGNKETTSGSGNPVTGNKPIDSTSIKRAKDSILQAAKKKATDDARKAAANALNNMFKKN
jgi:major membrane immunogen (membrane-anchored lipoprotein)